MAYIGPAPANSIIATSDIEDDAITTAKIVDSAVTSAKTSFTTGTFSSDLTSLTVNSTGDTSAGDNAAIGYTSAEGLILTGQGSTDDITVKNDADTTVLNVATGGTNVEVSAGNIFFGTADKGIYLGVTSATAANLLDDYEEGTYNPVISGSDGGSFDLSSSYDTFSYTKIGRLVTINGYIDIVADGDADGAVQISLPFAPVAMAESSDQCQSNCVILNLHSDSDTGSNIVGYVTTGHSRVRLYENAHGTGVGSYLNHTEVDAVFGLNLNLFYYS